MRVVCLGCLAELNSDLLLSASSLTQVGLGRDEREQNRVQVELQLRNKHNKVNL